MKVLLVDAGNTRLKWAVKEIDADSGSNPDELAVGRSCQYSITTLQEQLQTIWAELPPIDKVLLASVANVQIEHNIRQFITDYTGAGVQVLNSQPSGGGIQNAYHHHGQLGVDRWLAMRGGWKRRPAAVPLWVVDCGTAITIDYVDCTGQHLGGLILPGLGMMARQLSQDASQLDYGQGGLEVMQENEVAELARDTATAIRVGVMTSIVATIERVIARYPDSGFRVITGGDGERIHPLLSGDWHNYPHLVLEGLAAVAEERV